MRLLGVNQLIFSWTDADLGGAPPEISLAVPFTIAIAASFTNTDALITAR
jgi:hypothetical protein